MFTLPQAKQVSTIAGKKGAGPRGRLGTEGGRVGERAGAGARTAATEARGAAGPTNERGSALG
jgi:hypothetical protein